MEKGDIDRLTRWVGESFRGPNSVAFGSFPDNSPQGVQELLDAEKHIASMLSELGRPARVTLGRSARLGITFMADGRPEETQ